MTIGTFFTACASAIVTGIKSVIGAIAGASIASVAKVAIVIGGSIYVGYMLIHHFTANKKNYEEKKDETQVDRNLCLNYDDPKEFKKMNPLISEDKNLYKSIKKLRKNHHMNPTREKYYDDYYKRHDSRYLDKQQRDLDTLTEQVQNLLFPGGKCPDEPTDDDFNETLRQLKHATKMAEYDDSLKDLGEDNFSLRRIWNSCAY